VKREQNIFTLKAMKRRQESGIGISFIDSKTINPFNKIKKEKREIK